MPNLFFYLNENVVLQNTCAVRSPSSLNLIRKIAKRATTQSGESKKPCLLISGNRIIKQERASQFGRRKQLSLKAGAVTLRGLNVFHFIIFRHKLLFLRSPPLIVCSIANREKDEKRPPAVAEIKKQKEPRLTGIYYSHTYGAPRRMYVCASNSSSTYVIFFTHSLSHSSRRRVSLSSHPLYTKIGLASTQMPVAAAALVYGSGSMRMKMRLRICTQFYFNQSARKSAGRPINSAFHFISLTQSGAFHSRAHTLTHRSKK